MSSVEDRIVRCKQEIAFANDQLKWLEITGFAIGDPKEKDLAKLNTQAIESQRRIIDIYEGILARLEERQG